MTRYQRRRLRMFWLRRWVRRSYADAYADVLVAANDQDTGYFTECCARAVALSRVFGIQGPACDDVRAILLGRPVAPMAWDAAYQRTLAGIDRELEQRRIPAEWLRLHSTSA